MSVPFSRRSKVLLSLVASMTFGSALLFRLAPTPIGPRPLTPLAGTQPEESARRGPAVAWERIVIHESRSSSGGLSDLDKAHAAEWGDCAYHFVVGPTGTIEASARWRRQAAAPPEADGSTIPGIHIVLIGQFDHQPPADRQLAALRLLTSDLLTQFAIPADKVYLHSQVQRLASPCPGPSFPAQWMADTPR